MPSLTYIGEPDRVYPSLGLEPVPGESYDVEDVPQDGRWASVSTPESPQVFTPPPAAPEPAPEPSVTAEPTPTTEA